jgi:hypothetical protein
MAIFSNSDTKSKVFYRRKSIRLANYTLGLASVIGLAFGISMVASRNQETEMEVDEITTDTLALH